MKTLKPSKQRGRTDYDNALDAIRAAVDGKVHEIESRGEKIVSVKVEDADEAAISAVLADAERDFPGAF